MNALKLSKAQQDLLNAMRNGVICHYMAWTRNNGSYYFRSDTMGHCSATASALLRRGLVEIESKDWRGHKLRLKQ